MGKGTVLALQVVRNEREPIFLALARAIIGEIERGRLSSGDPLPGTRSLSKSLGLNRNTVDAAYQELLTQGWLDAAPSRGTFVARALPDFGKETRLFRPASRKAIYGQAVQPPGVRFSDGIPDTRLAPTVALGQAFRRAIVSPAFLSENAYGDPMGTPFLREALAFYLKDDRGLNVRADSVFITRGSQMALFLAASAIGEPGMSIAVESPGYPLAWSAFRAAGAGIRGIPIDEGGLDVDYLEKVAGSRPDLKAVYVTPHHQYPTTVTMSSARRNRLKEIACRYRLTIIEDDYDHEYRFEGPPVLPVAAHGNNEPSVIYLGSLSKLLAPGIRLGYAVAPHATLRRMADIREAIDRQGDFPLEQALGDLIADGTIRRHARKARHIYQHRRDVLASLLRENLGVDAHFDLPAGGLAIWLRLRPGLSAETWAANAARIGLSVLPGMKFVLDVAQASETFRLGYAALDDHELHTAVALLAASIPDETIL
ncbi:PLP-dependent aminotransferase family protein [Neorhizobium sp. AL 9.2.2]|uniref:MocR-like pyridoxine biosynthesis transcription factor PdxR n=1 Tax=Neorhizobium sp. AL 9.2.2 TaxID=2712894 RepID=UPI000DDDFA12|nr:PLP-dependent aminotransferase family protein [Neorhizobium sp. AL 9.2.2]NSY20175.1 PLP-dependent aminotransferase family protein [Neorhizobium sp. AL 9.2.2]